MSNTSNKPQSAQITIRRILVATDFSAAARLAVWRAAQLAKENDAYLHLIHARPDWNLFGSTLVNALDHYHAVGDYAERALTEELGFIEKSFGIHARGESRMGRASQVLSSVIDEIEPHLIVIGAHGEHQARGFVPFLGGTALKLAAFASIPILIVRKAGTGPYTVAVVAIEKSKRAARYLALWGCALLHSGDCHIAHAFDLPYLERMLSPQIARPEIERAAEEARKAAQNFTDQVVEELTTVGPRLHADVVRGEPVEAVLAAIDRLRPDLIVVGKHEHPPRDRLAGSLGSVAFRIAYHAVEDVLVVPSSSATL